jgi:hypothetical protein
MTLSLALVQVGLRIGRWLLPWVVFVSATLAFAVNVSTGEGTGPAAVERSTTSPSAQSADRGPIVTPEAARHLVVATWTRRSSRKAARSTAAGRHDVPAHGAYWQFERVAANLCV